MSIKYFYNIILKDSDNTILSEDILTDVRCKFFSSKEKIKDKFTKNSEDNALYYNYSIEEDKTMLWTVTDKSGFEVESIKPLQDGKYSICVNDTQTKTLSKKLYFSKYHTLLKVDYYSSDNSIYCEIEPRRASTGLCLMLKFSGVAEPVLVFSMPDISDNYVKEKVDTEFSEYYATASTDEGIVKFLTIEQREKLNDFISNCEKEKELELSDKSYINKEDAELASKLNPKYFNVKRNLSSQINISDAQPFDYEPSIESDDKKEEVIKNTDIPILDPELNCECAKTVENIPVDNAEQDIERDTAVCECSDESNSEYKILPDKMFDIDGEEYLYYGNIDENGNRTGYGKTLLNSKTTYEGEYLDDMRNGNGAYYYKDGGLCYYGEWKNNVREGLGIGVSSADKSIHVGTWKNNKPYKNGVRMSRDGEVKFVRKELSDGTTVLINFMPDESIVISKYDIYENKTSEKSYSIEDLTK